MAPNSRGLWTPRGTRARFRAWTHQPVLHTTLSPTPKFEPSRSLGRRSPTRLTDESVGELMQKSEGWRAEAAELEAEATAKQYSLEEQIADMMFHQDVALRIKEQEYLWDPSGDGVRAISSEEPRAAWSTCGAPVHDLCHLTLSRSASRATPTRAAVRAGPQTVSIGEFRKHLRALGLSFNLAEADELFEMWDEDSNGSIDMDELRTALVRMYRGYKERLKAQGLPIAASVQWKIRGKAADGGVEPSPRCRLSRHSASTSP